MPQYRHRPNIVEAWQWAPYPETNPPQWFVDALRMGIFEQVHVGDVGGQIKVMLKVHAGKGDILANVSDWIIVEEGDFSVSDPASFLKSFDPVDRGQAAGAGGAGVRLMWNLLLLADALCILIAGLIGEALVAVGDAADASFENGFIGEVYGSLEFLAHLPWSALQSRQDRSGGVYRPRRETVGQTQPHGR
jgi:hypothetical protein